MKTAIQRIIVPLDPSDYARAATLHACHIARSHGAELTGITVLDSPGIRSQVAPLDTYHWTLVQDTIRTALADAKERIRDVEDHFAQTCREQNVPFRETESEGVPASVLLECSGLQDLIVVGLRTFFHFETRDKPGDSLSQLLHRTATPILAVPDTIPIPSLKTVSIAYDGSMNSARALREFASFSAPLNQEITLINANPDQTLGQHLLQEASSYLRTHGIEPNHTSQLAKNELAPDDLQGADLIVAGIHSRRFFHDLAVGNLTSKLIEQADTPLFLSH